MKQYNAVPLDGRPMHIQLATSNVPNLLRNSTASYGNGLGGQGATRSFGATARRGIKSNL